MSSYTIHDFAIATLIAGNWPITQSNINFLERWQWREGGTAQGANNPMNTKLAKVSLPQRTTSTGSVIPATTITATKVLPNGIAVWSDINTGAVATAATIENGYYPNIIAALKAGDASEADASGSLAPDFSKWSDGEYTNIENEPLNPNDSIGATNPDGTPAESAAGQAGVVTPGLGIGFSSVSGFLSAISGAVGWLTTAKNWLRIGEMLLGVALSVIGLVLMFKGKGALPIPIPI